MRDCASHNSFWSAHIQSFSFHIRWPIFTLTFMYFLLIYMCFHCQHEMQALRWFLNDFSRILKQCIEVYTDVQSRQMEAAVINKYRQLYKDSCVLTASVFLKSSINLKIGKNPDQVLILHTASHKQNNLAGIAPINLQYRHCLPEIHAAWRANMGAVTAAKQINLKSPLLVNYKVILPNK